jgi:polysaccharide deacetylase 2 family uncharacterized protein YibQ
VGRGIISGTIWGFALSALALSAASLLGPPPPGQPTEGSADAGMFEADGATAAANGGQAGAVPTSELSDDVSLTDGALADVSQPQGSEPPRTDPPLAEAASVAAAIPQVAVPRADAPLPDTDTDPARRPLTEGVETLFGAPSEGTSPEFAAAADEPVLPNPQARPPQLPAREDDLSISTEPAAAPDAQPAPDGAADAAALAASDQPASGDPVAAPPVSADPADDVLPAMPADPELPAPADVADISDAPQPMIDAEAPSLLAPAIDDAVGAPFVQRLPQVGGAAAISGDSAAFALPTSTDRVRINRSFDYNTAENGAEHDAENLSASPTAALVRFGADVVDPGDLALMSVVLIDDGHISGLAAALRGVPFPVTIAIDPARADATQVMETYRAAGIEVLAIARLPEGAQPSDVEVTLGYAFGVLPQTIGLLDTGGGVQADGAVAGQMVAVLAAEGRALVSAARGLNMGLRAAAEAGVPAHMIHRELDAEGQDAPAIRRQMDQAAFQARRESGVILLGRVRPDTISALTLWGSQLQPGVALVPVSTLLRAR